MAQKKHCLLSRPQKCHKPESENDNGECQEEGSGSEKLACIQHKTDIVLKDIDTDIDALISENWPQLMSEV